MTDRQVRLAAADYRNLLALVEAAQSVARLDDFPAFVTSWLPNIVACDSISYNEVDPLRKRTIAVLHPDTGRFPQDTELFSSLLEQHPLISYYQRTRDGRALKISDFLSDAEFQALDIYQLIYRRLATRHQISVTLPAPEPIIIGIALNRSDVDFVEKDRLMLNLLRPHLEYAYHRLQAQDQTTRALSALRQGLDAASQGVVVLGPSGDVAFANQPADRLLRRFAGSPAEPGSKPPAALDRWLVGQRHALAGSIDGSAPAEALILEDSSGKLVCRFLPGVRADDNDVVLLDEEKPEFDAPSLAAFGLTRREIDVLGMVAKGHTNAQVAERLVISERTVQKHLEHVFKKLRVSTRTAAVARTTDTLR